MAVNLVTWFWILLGGYAGLGLLFSLYFSFAAAGKVDPVAREGTWGFKLLIIPGMVALWPLFIRRLSQGIQQPPPEKNAHRLAARGPGEGPL